MKYVDEVVPCNWLIDEAFLDQHNIDLLVHGMTIVTQLVQSICWYCRVPRALAVVICENVWCVL
nr:hypothetical protein [Methylotenera sp.]